MFNRSTVSCLVLSFALVSAIFFMAWDSYSNVREYLNSVQAASGSYSPCQYEDGSGPNQEFPCYWDAQAQGNGQGHSFILFSPDHIQYVFKD